MNIWNEKEKELEALKAEINSLRSQITLNLQHSNKWCNVDDVRMQVIKLEQTRRQLYLLKSKVQDKIKQIQKESEFNAGVLATAAIGLGLLSLFSSRKKK